jgi:hypothetical protein
MRSVFSGGDVSDEARRNVRSLEIELAKSEAVTQESLGRSARKFSPQEEHSAESAFQSARETPYGSGLITRFQR